jgi:hypothetical protein
MAAHQSRSKVMVPSSSLSFPLVIQRLYAFMICYNQKNDSRTLLDGIVQPISYISASWDYVAFIRQFLVDCCEVELVSAPFAISCLSSRSRPITSSNSFRPPTRLPGRLLASVIFPSFRLIHRSASFASLTRLDSHEHQDTSPPTPLKLSDSQ